MLLFIFFASHPSCTSSLFEWDKQQNSADKCLYREIEVGQDSWLLRRKILAHYVLVEQSTQILYFVERKPVMNKHEQ